MGNCEFLSLCKQQVAKYFNTHIDKSDATTISEDDVYVVGIVKLCKTTKRF